MKCFSRNHPDDSWTVAVDVLVILEVRELAQWCRRHCWHVGWVPHQSDQGEPIKAAAREASLQAFNKLNTSAAVSLFQSKEGLVSCDTAAERMASLLGLYGGGGRKRVHAKRRGGKAAWRSAAPVRQLLRRLWRRGTARSRRPAVRFGYDLQSYAQNFDDGLGSSGHLL
ncbi:hypothetical protein EJB05_22047, partial [Eragrostis curvula]